MSQEKKQLELAERELAETRREWQPIETVPKDGSLVLLSNGVDVWSAWWVRDSVWPWVTQRGDCTANANIPMKSKEATHWMPLPRSPE